MSASGGTFKLMRPAWSLGVGATLGDGSQRMPMIALEDYLRALIWAAETPDVSGPYNLTIPEPTTNREFSDVLAKALRRPRFLAAPAPVLRAVLGELAEQLVGDMYVLPARLTQAGFSFAAPDVRTLVASALSD
jgi:NAD dependent epimerase/dehydratase family enzyme